MLALLARLVLVCSENAANPYAICAGKQAFGAEATDPVSRQVPLNWRDRL
jgi:hypothetical protein